MHILDSCQFSDIHISQVSVATHIRCGGIFKYEFVANLPVSLSVKNFENRLTFGKVMGKSLVSCFFETQCSCAPPDLTPLAGLDSTSPGS